eukprot:CAMPEP_0172706874 /NCGR_PEP_ID=MMETSP1074-20121228/47495_1 /TAXON_ID=2916 /ORGANISM="Ceratium fusus, Strain PA161109" /LENGTH=48 /DNA_ID= /DNA_START= /DNA_END= /DNA_ORIENTATION=
MATHGTIAFGPVELTGSPPTEALPAEPPECMTADELFIMAVPPPASAE